jgi:hypothetical protein
MVCPISAFSRGLGSVVLMLALAMGPATGCSDDVPSSSGDGSSTTGVATGTTSSATITVGSADDTVGSTSGGMGSTATSSSSSGEPGTESSGTTQGLSTTDGSSSSGDTTSGGSTTDATASGSTTDATTDPTSGGSTTDFTSSGGMTTGATDFGSTSGDPSGTTDGGSDTGIMVEVPDFSGDFLLVLATPLDPTLPFQYVANFDYVPSGFGGGTVDVEMQPLALDTGSTTTPRTFFGPPLVFPGIPVTPDGTFAVPVGILDVAAETNPLFFIDAQANNVVMSVQVLDADDLCGTVTGSLVFPVASSLDGTTLAAVRVLDVMPAGLPLVFPVACP